MAGLRDVYIVAHAASIHPAAAADALAVQHEYLQFNADAHPIIPLLAAAPYLAMDNSGRSSNIQLWQPQQFPSSQPLASSQNPTPIPTASYICKSSSGMDSSSILFVAGGASTCQDCGNQAKKDCRHHRCRTCCKSRGFYCSTHIKSTWVPAARRRERHFTASDSAAVTSSSLASTLKKPRLLSSPTPATLHLSDSNTRSFDTGGSSHQDASFRDNLPGRVRAPAVFKCVRVTSAGDGDDEYAYQAKVNIGGHVFKGFLYNHGTDGTEAAAASEAENNNVYRTSGDIPNLSELHLGSGSLRNVPHSETYGRGGLLGGVVFGDAIN